MKYAAFLALLVLSTECFGETLTFEEAGLTLRTSPTDFTRVTSEFLPTNILAVYCTKPGKHPEYGGWVQIFIKGSPFTDPERRSIEGNVRTYGKLPLQAEKEGASSPPSFLLQFVDSKGKTVEISPKHAMEFDRLPRRGRKWFVWHEYELKGKSVIVSVTAFHQHPSKVPGLKEAFQTIKITVPNQQLKATDESSP